MSRLALGAVKSSVGNPGDEGCLVFTLPLFLDGIRGWSFKLPLDEPRST